jgi:hydroxyethylthiazole kinase-like uncharacterized protein yjeF
MALPILSVERMRAWEQASWSAGRRESEVISKVGEALARTLRQYVPLRSRLLLVAGTGHNGDDVRAALPHLKEFEVETIRMRDPVAEFYSLEHGLRRQPAWIVDGLFGLGLNRDLEAGWLPVVRKLNESGVPVLAMDVPSGLDADTGEPRGAVVRAAVTLTVGAPKRGLLVPRAVEWVGQLEIATQVGLLETIPGPKPGGAEWGWSEASDFVGWPARRLVAAHKGDFGHAVLVAGSRGWHGAAVLAARGAQRARPGLVTVLTRPDAYLPVASQLAAAMVRPWEPSDPLPENATALVVGPGLAEASAPAEIGPRLREWWDTFPGPMVVDASALDWLAPASAASAGVRVITPHAGEAARLLQTTAAAIQADRPAALQALSRRFGDCWVVLKGRHTLIGRTGEGPWWNGSGNPGLAQGGSGDVLAGYLGGLLAQPSGSADPLTAIRAAVWRHGAAADRLEQAGRAWHVEELTDALGDGLKA